MTPDLRELHIIDRPRWEKEIRDLKYQLYKTPKWRVVKRYRLFEKIEAEEEALSLCDHILLEDDDPL